MPKPKDIIHIPAVRDAFLRMWYDKRYTTTEIADAFETTRTTVWRWARRLGAAKHRAQLQSLRELLLGLMKGRLLSEQVIDNEVEDFEAKLYLEWGQHEGFEIVRILVPTSQMDVVRRFQAALAKKLVEEIERAGEGRSDGHGLSPSDGGECVREDADPSGEVRDEGVESAGADVGDGSDAGKDGVGGAG